MSTARQQRVVWVLDQLTQALETGHRPQGLGLRKLRQAFWEVRSGLDLRILFRLTGDVVELVMVGSHEEIRRALAGR